ncbi:hypothetical protein Tco_1093258 [Tanacetum coccineum]|uniref:Uncharacterized protein n=1 Tax=Tanacetum coccineum TaxID=301880 RepID=A0ABQ5IDH6_9ASTR
MENVGDVNVGKLDASMQRLNDQMAGNVNVSQPNRAARVLSNPSIDPVTNVVRNAGQTDGASFGALGFMNSGLSSALFAAEEDVSINKSTDQETIRARSTPMSNRCVDGVQHCITDPTKVTDFGPNMCSAIGFDGYNIVGWSTLASSTKGDGLHASSNISQVDGCLNKSTGCIPIKLTKPMVILGVSITSKKELIGLAKKFDSGALDDVISGLTTPECAAAHALVLDLTRGFNYVNSDSYTDDIK